MGFLTKLIRLSLWITFFTFSLFPSVVAAQDLPVETVVQTGHSQGLHCGTFSPDGKYFVTGSYDGNVKLWDVATGREVRTFTGHFRQVIYVSFSPDGQYIATA